MVRVAVRLSLVALLAVAALLALSSAALARPRVVAPPAVAVGQVVEVRVSGFRPSAQVQVALTPASYSEGNGAGILVVPRTRTSATGSARLRFRWPAG